MAENPENAAAVRAPHGDRDALTATLSRQAFIARLTEHAERARVKAAAFGLCLVDIDHFKNINLSHGPTCGDEALCDVAQRLVRTNCSAGASDALVGRYDGDAFVVLVETESLDALAAAAEALRAAVHGTASGGTTRVTASVGAALARIGEPAEAALVRAEQALYLAKQFGRDRVEVDRGPQPQRAAADVRPLERTA